MILLTTIPTTIVNILMTHIHNKTYKYNKYK